MLKRFMPRTLFGRSLLILVTPLLLVQIVTTIIFFDNHWDKMTTRLTFSVVGEIAGLTERIEESEDPTIIRQVSDYSGRFLNINTAFLPGGTIARPARRTDQHSNMGRKLYEELALRINRPFSINIDREEKWIEVNVQVDGGTLSYLIPERRLYSSSSYIVILWMIGTSIIMLAIAILFMRNQIKPIRRLAIAAEKLGKGRDVPFFKIEGAREVRQAAQAFQDMRKRIDRQMAQRTEMLAGVSHDLRTPLTRMKLQIEMLPDGKDKDDLRADMADMQKMIDAYLQFARGDGKEPAERVDIGEMVGRIAENMRRGSGKNVALSVQDGFISLMGRPIALERCLTNLMNNAVKYASSVQVDLSKSDEEIVLLIDDDGPGVPIENREDVFKPFYRGDQSRSAKTGGVGLGLPIAQDIIHSHGGEITLGDSPMGGLRVEVRLPL